MTRARACAGVLGAALTAMAVLLAVAGPFAPTASATNFTAGQAANLQLGSPDFASYSRGTQMTSGLDQPWGLQRDVSGRVLVADGNNNRVLIWNTMPTTDGAAFSLAVGTEGIADPRRGCDTNKTNRPVDVWSSGTKLAVVDKYNHRVLLWNTFPTTTGQAPDVVLGQTGPTTCSVGSGASGLHQPQSVWTNGTKLLVADQNNHRVLVWNTWPTANNQAANLVLGQADLNGTTANRGGASPNSNTARLPTRCSVTPRSRPAPAATPT